MERQEFLKTLGISFAAVCAGSCLSACGKDGDNTPNNGTTPPPTGTFVSANLSDLTTVGSFKVVNSVLFFRMAMGNTPASFGATQATCPHQSAALVWKQTENLIQCTRHSAKYSTSGEILAQPSDGGMTSKLSVYPITAVSETTVTAKTI